MTTPRVLLLEDDASLQTLLDTALTHAGYAVTTAIPNDYLFMAQEVKPHIVILGSNDRELGDAGWTMAQLLNQTFPRLVVILLSTHAAVIDEVGVTPRGRCFDAGLRKPFKVDQLLQLIVHHYR